PSLFRPWRLVCSGNNGQSSVVLFRYASITTQEFEDAEVATAGGAPPALVYDVLDGMLPNITAVKQNTINVNDGTANRARADIGNVRPGNFLVVANRGDPYTPPGWSVVQRQDYVGVVLGVNPTPGGPYGGNVVVNPPFPTPIPVLTPLQFMRR